MTLIYSNNEPLQLCNLKKTQLHVVCHSECSLHKVMFAYWANTLKSVFEVKALRYVKTTFWTEAVMLHLPCFQWHLFVVMKIVANIMNIYMCLRNLLDHHHHPMYGLCPSCPKLTVLMITKIIFMFLYWLIHQYV